MNRKNGNLYLSYVVQADIWKVVASTSSDAEMIEGQDVFCGLGLPDSEREFIGGALLEDVSLPILVIGQRNGEKTAIIIHRSMVFETSICPVLEINSRGSELICGIFGRDLEGVIASPLAKRVVSECENSESDALGYISALSDLREIFALGNINFDGRLSVVSSFEDIISCVKNLIGIEIDLEMVYGSCYTGDTGRIFSSGICVCVLLSFAMAARRCSNDSRMRVALLSDNGYLTLDVSFAESKKRIWRGDALLERVCQAYGIPIEIRHSEGLCRCICIPEYADEALEGVKEDILYRFWAIPE